MRIQRQLAGQRALVVLLFAAWSIAGLTQQEEFDSDSLDFLFEEQSAEQRPAGDAEPAQPPAAPETDDPAGAVTDTESQRAPPPAASTRARPSRGRAVEEIIVTAERREASLKDTPISIAVLGEQQLVDAGIEGLGDIGANVPSLQIVPFPTNNATLSLYIRGTGIIDAQITQDPAVGIYLDGVYIARSTGTALDVADIKRIEVLRGPQGTLYGRNATGGAVNIITHDPSTEAFDLDQTLSFGNRGILKSKTNINLPLTDSLAAKFSLLESQRDGFIENTGPGGDFGDREQTGGRLDVRWAVPGLPAVDYSYDFSDITSFNYQPQHVLTPEGNKGPAEFIKRDAQANSVYSSQRLDSLATGLPLEPSGSEIEGHALTVTEDLWGLQFKYIGAYRSLLNRRYADLGGGAGSTSYRLDRNRYDGPAATFATGGPTPLVIPELDQDQWSHELQITGGTPASGLSYIVGLYYFEEEAVEDLGPTHHQVSGAIRPDEVPEELGPIFSEFGPRIVGFANIRNEIANEAKAVFGRFTWTPNWFDRRLHLTFGYRRSEDDRAAVKTDIVNSVAEIQQNGVGVGVSLTDLAELPLGPVGDALAENVSLFNVEQFDAVAASRSFSDDSFSLIGEFDLTPGVNVYGKYNEAYKSGGFNTRDPQIDGNSGPAADGVDYGFGFKEGFAPERVAAYEVGLKGDFFGGLLRLNTDVFLTLFEDRQVNFLIEGTVGDSKVANLGEARTSGFELDATLLATRDLVLNASYAYLDADVTKVIDVRGNDVTDEFQFASAPPHSLTLRANWTLLERPWGSLAGYLNYNYVDRRLGGTRTGLPVQLPSYAVFNARLGVNDIPIGGLSRLNFALWGKNLLDEEYEINAINNLPSADRSVFWGESRTFGLDAIYRY